MMKRYNDTMSRAVPLSDFEIGKRPAHTENVDTTSRHTSHDTPKWLQ